MVEPALLEEAADLFNRKLYFECHDLLEEAWSDERGEDRAFLQALIHVSVGLYHVAAGNHKGAVSLLERAVDGLEAFAPRRHGLDVAALLERAGRCLEKSRAGVEGAAVSWEPADVPRFELSGVE